jgi:glycosyltransferase involved in cell wall biosynthesis
VREQVDALSGRIEVRVLFLDVMKRGDRRPAERSITRERGYAEERVEVPNFPGLWQSAYSVAICRELQRIRREFAPQVVHAHTAVPAGWSTALVNNPAGAPLVLTEHSSEFESWMRRPVLRWMARTAFRRADVVVAVSEGQRRRIVSTFRRTRRLMVIPNMVDTDFFASWPMPGTKNGFRLLLVGLMDTDQKGVHILLDALDLVARGGKISTPIRVTVAGDGALRPRYEEQAQRLGLGEMVHFAGLRTQAEIARLLDDSHALVMPSLHESAGMALLQAMAVGRPAVVTRSGGPEFYIGKQGGLVVEPGDANALATGIVTLLTNLDRYEPTRIAERTRALYGREAVTGRLLALYERLAKR